MYSNPQTFVISSPIFSEPTNTYHLNTDFLHPTPVAVPLSPASSDKSCFSSDEELTFRMDQLNNVKKLLNMFPPPMSAIEFITRNPFLATDGHIKRPSNNFILFRKIAHDQKNQAPDLSNYNERQWSQIVGKIWKTLSVEEKTAYKNLGEQVANIHHEMYPNYKYQPKRDKAAWKHFNPIENNSRKLKSKRKSKVKQQKHQEAPEITSYQNMTQQQQLMPQSSLDYTTPVISAISTTTGVAPEFLFDTEMFVDNFAFSVNEWMNIH